MQKSTCANCKNHFVQNAQKKCKNLFVRPHKKIGAFSNKENDDVAQNLFCDNHFLQVAESKNCYLLTAKSLLGIHFNLFLLEAHSNSSKLQKRITAFSTKTLLRQSLRYATFPVACVKASPF